MLIALSSKMQPEIKKDYFELVKSLNMSNKLKDQKTQLYFFVSQDKFLYAAVSDDQKVLLGIKILRWRQSNLMRFPHLEKFVCDFLNQSSVTTDLTLKILTAMFKFPD